MPGLTTTTPPPSHIVVQTIQAWGHARSVVTFCAQLTKLHPDVYITLLTSDGYFPRIKRELARSFDDHHEECAQRVRIVSLGHSETLVTSSDDPRFHDMWQALISEKEAVCAHTGVRHTPMPKPRALIADLFAINDVKAVKALSGDSVKIYTWLAGMVYAILYLFGPEHMGGKGNIRQRAEEEAQRTGRKFEEAAWELSFKANGEVIHLPGLPPMYDYEHDPQDFPNSEELGIHLLPYVHETLQITDGALLTSPEAYEPEAIAACKAWFAETARPVYSIGPLLPTASKATAAAHEKKQSHQAEEIHAFLDETLGERGEHSLLYISFGSIFWPAMTPEKLWAFLDVIMELGIPFILSHASPLAEIPDEVKEKVKVYGKGIMSPWSPQQLILDHPATGWYVTHGGHNGLTEAMVSGVPLIVWPFSADQPLNAIMVAEQHMIGYELLEVRSGHGLKQIYRTGYTPVGTEEAIKEEARDVLVKAFGEDGEEKRQRLKILRKAVLREWEEGGSSMRDVTLFLDNLQSSGFD